VPAGPEFLVNTYTTQYQFEPRVRFGAGGAFVVTWDGYGPGDIQGIFARRYNATGTPLGGEFRVNSSVADYQAHASLATDPSGRFVIAWEDYALDGNEHGIFARRYDNAGVALGGQFPVNTYTPGDQSRPSVAADATGAFTVAWYNGPIGDGSYESVQARQFNSSGVALGSEFRVNTYTTGNQSYPNVVARGPGNFLVLWEGSGPQDVYGVFGQRYGDVMFNDGFNICPP
jgi:hypothetical protein